MTNYARLIDAIHDTPGRLLELLQAADHMLLVERTQGVTDEEHEAAVARLDAAASAFH